MSTPDPIDFDVMPNAVIKRNDTAQPWTYTLKIRRRPADLTGCTVALHLKQVTPVAGTVVVRGGVQIDPVVKARTWYYPLDDDVIGAGRYELEYEVTYPDGKTRTFPKEGNLGLTIVEDLA